MGPAAAERGEAYPLGFCVVAVEPESVLGRAASPPSASLRPIISTWETARDSGVLSRRTARPRKGRGHCRIFVSFEAWRRWRRRPTVVVVVRIRGAVHREDHSDGTGAPVLFAFSLPALQKVQSLLADGE